METAKELNVPQDRYEFQVLYGMAEPFRKALLKMTGRVRLYCPHGQLLPGMAYLIRRLLENTANESFLRQSFVEGAELEQLMEDPEKTLQLLQVENKDVEQVIAGEEKLSEFTNEPFADLSREQVRDNFTNAIKEVRGQLGRSYPLYIDGKEVTTKEMIHSVNPSRPSEVIGRVSQASVEEASAAMDAAKRAFLSWRDVGPKERGDLLIKAAEIMRSRICEICAWQILEEAKQWRQAYNDVAEAIDFLEYYARQMIRLS